MFPAGTPLCSCGGGKRITVRNVVSLNGGKPLSVTRTDSRLVEGAGRLLRFQVRRPVPESMPAWAGGLSRLKRRLWKALSASVAVTVNRSVCPAWKYWLGIGVSRGAVLGIWFGARGVGTGMK